MLGLTVASLLALPALALNVNDPVKINEVSYDPPESPEEPFEYLELYNAGGSTVYLDGAVISDEGNNGTAEATFQFPGIPGGTTIPLAPGAYLLITSDATGSTLGPDYEFYGGVSDTDDPLVPNLVKTSGTATDMFLGNSGDGVVLAIGTTMGSIIPCAEVVDGASWEGGGTGETNAMSSTVCSDPAPHAGYVNTPQSLQRCPNGSDSDNSTTDFVVANRTPKAANLCGFSPPVIANLRYAPCFVTAGVQVTLTCTVTDPDNDVTLVRAYYKLEAAASYDSVTMTQGLPTEYSAILPGQADQSHVLYYVMARDAVGNTVKNPSTAPSFNRSYRVGLQTIASLQVPLADSCGTSTLDGKAVNVVGVVTHHAYEYSDDFFYIQQGTAANSGIKVFAPDSAFVPVYADSVRVSGYLDEYRCATEIVLFADCGTILGHNRKVRARQLASLADVELEQNESMLVTVQGPMTAVAGFDTTTVGQTNFIEFRAAAGGDTAWVGDDTFFPDGIGYTIVPEPGMSFDALTGIVGARLKNTFDNVTILRLEPRRDNDVDRDWTDLDDPDQLAVVRAFHLRQNAPNPFNPATVIEFAVPSPGRVALRIYDTRGQLVRTLLDTQFAAPKHARVAWDGRDDAGRVVSSGVYFYKLETADHVASRKMLLLK
jgi:hypothetical protein